MHEVAFLKQNAEKWKSYETILKQAQKADPDTLADVFIQVTDDLAYANTFFPSSKTTQYLNGLATEVHQTLYENKREERGRFITFWKTELPLVFYASRRELGIALLVFLISIGIGIVSGNSDDGFARLIMSDGYINMTLDNIEKGDPLAVYKKANELDMFLGITFNNVRVALLAFAAGIVLSFGTVFILFRNGVMVGAIHAFFEGHDLLFESLLVIYIHGALELSAIVLAGGAGLVMGNSILFPGTYTRLQSFLHGAKRGLKIIIGLIPIFITAGFIEGFVTRYTSMPLWLSLCIILGSFAFIIWYTILYPNRLVRHEQQS